MSKVKSFNKSLEQSFQISISNFRQENIFFFFRKVLKAFEDKKLIEKTNEG